jgi:hypothetical protein
MLELKKGNKSSQMGQAPKNILNKNTEQLTQSR